MGKWATTLASRRLAVRISAFLNDGSPRFSPDLGKRVARAASTFGISHQDAAFNKCGDVTQRGVVLTFRELPVFHGSERSLEAIKQSVKQQAVVVHLGERP